MARCSNLSSKVQEDDAEPCWQAKAPYLPPTQVAAPFSILCCCSHRLYFLSYPSLSREALRCICSPKLPISRLSVTASIAHREAGLPPAPTPPFLRISSTHQVGLCQALCGAKGPRIDAIPRAPKSMRNTKQELREADGKGHAWVLWEMEVWTGFLKMVLVRGLMEGDTEGDSPK